MIKMCNGKAVRILQGPIMKTRITLVKRDSAAIGVMVIGEQPATREEIAYYEVEFITTRIRGTVPASALTEVREPE